MLIVFGGLPGTGKTTISRAIATRQSATYLRIDAIEQAIRDAAVLAGGVGPAGYVVANVLAESNLIGGRTVVADCVNPVGESREAWRAIASRANVRLVEVEVICTDPLEHRRRVEVRTSDIPGLIYPTWQAVLERDYEPWEEPHLIVDTARLSADQAIAVVERHIGA
jgi:predicted kinase